MSEEVYKKQTLKWTTRRKIHRAAVDAALGPRIVIYGPAHKPFAGEIKLFS